MSDGWVDVGPRADLRFEPGARVRVGARDVALFEDGDRLHAIDDSCPHAGGSLAEGDRDGDAVSCLWHGYRYELASGRCLLGDDVPVRRHEARVVGDRVQVRLAAD